MLTLEQDTLLGVAKSVIQHQLGAGDHVPCFGLLLDKQMQVHQFVRSCEAGQEEQLFGEIVTSLKSGVVNGALCTGLVIFLDRSKAETTGGATVDLEQLGAQRMIGFLSYSIAGSKVAFETPQFVAKPSVLYRAP